MTQDLAPETQPRPAWRTPMVIMLCGALVFMLSAGTRQTFGLFLRPMSSDLGWGREVFAFSVALLTLLMGATTPFMGAIADRFGSGRVILFGFRPQYRGQSVATFPLLFNALMVER